MNLDDFKCKMCGSCCKIKGIVRLSNDDISVISSYLNMEESDFINKYTHVAPDRTGLVFVDQENGACIMYEEGKGCKIHAVKPFQCQRFPYDWVNPDSFQICEGLKELV